MYGVEWMSKDLVNMSDMREGVIRNSLHFMSSSLMVFSMVIMTTVGEVLSVGDAKTAPIFVRSILGFVRSSAWWILLYSGLIAIVAKIIAKALGDPLKWKQINTVLDQLKDHAFTDSEDDHLHHCRVTLFKFNRCKFWIFPFRGFTPWGGYRGPCSGWLVPVARSGHTTQRSKAIFLAPDDADSVEGIAGVAWNKRGSVPCYNLPDLNGNPTDTEIDLYAKRTFVPYEKLKKDVRNGKKFPCALSGMPIEVKGKRWGVLVLDSRRPDGIKEPRLNFISYEITAKFLESLLE